MKTIRFRKGNIRVVGFENLFVSYGKNVYSKYRLEIKTPFHGIAIPLWYNKKKPYFRNISLIALLVIPFVPPVMIGAVIGTLIAMYVDGAINFIKDGACVNNIRFFGWTNIVIILLLLFIKFIML